MGIILSGVADELNAQVLANEASSECSASEHAPLQSLELTTSKMSSHAWSRHNGSCCTSTSQTQCQSKRGPAALSTEEIFLVEQEAVWRLDDAISSLIRCVVITPSGDEGLVKVLLALPDGA